MNTTRFVLRPVRMERAFLLIADDRVERPRELLDRMAEESTYDPPKVSLRTIWCLIRDALRGVAPGRSVSL